MDGIGPRLTALIHIRRASGLTQAQVAAQLGISKATYSAWETGRAVLGADRIVALAELFKCTPNDILGYSDSEGGILHPHGGRGGIPASAAAPSPEHQGGRARHHEDNRQGMALKITNTPSANVGF